MSKALLLLFVVAACDLGTVPGGGNDLQPDASIQGGGDSGAVDPNETSFNNTIKPLVVNCTACHGAATPPNLSSYAALQAKYKVKPGNANILVTKGDATAGVHQGVPYFDTTQKATVAAWIDGLQ